MRANWRFLVSTIVFGLCLAPTLVCYEPYSFDWDDADYLLRSILVSRAFWSANKHAMRMVMVDIRPPIMTVLGLPWGPLTSWDSVGKCFITLTALTAAFVAGCLFLLLRVGLRPLYLVIASTCVFAALGPYPAGAEAHYYATCLGADSLFAWIAFAALLLIPYEATTHTPSTADSLLRGFLWALIFSAGAITKVSFGYFIVLVIPILFVVRIRNSGLRSALLSLASLTVCSSPVVFYWLRYGLLALKDGWTSSFGHEAAFFFVPLPQFVRETVRQSPGLLLWAVFVIAGLIYLVIKRRELARDAKVLPLLLAVLYCTISLGSSNREIRYSYLGIIAVPFLVGILMPGKPLVLLSRTAATAAIVVFCFLVAVAVPMRHRASRRCLAKSEAVLGEAVESHAKRVLLATDSPTLNINLMRLASAISPALADVESSTLAYNAASYGTRLEDDFREIHKFELVVFQKKETLSPAYTNLRVSEYEQYTRQCSSDGPIQVAGDISIYRIDRNSP